MEINNTKTVVQGALLLTIAGLISKVLSATYRIPLQNLTGDLGFYIYQQIYPLIGTVMILSLYGFPVAISTLTAEMKRKNMAVTYQNFYFPLFSILFMISCAIFLFIYFMAPAISFMIGDNNLTALFQLGAFLFLLIPFLALLRGAFQGHEAMHHTAYSQIIEQIVRVSIIIVGAYYITTGNLDIYNVGKVGIFATMAGMLVAIIVLAIIFIPKQSVGIQLKVKIPWRYYFYTCLSLGVVASLNHMILIMIQFVDVFTLVPNLITYGLSPIEAMKEKGIFDRGQPLIQFGVVFGSSFALAIIPAVIREGIHTKTYVGYVREALLFGFYLATGATIGLILILPEANVLLFTNKDGTGSLQILVVSILLSSITITASAILQSLGVMKQLVLWIGVTCAVKWMLNELLIPFLGIHGSALATIGSLAVLCIAVIVMLQQKLPEIDFIRSIKWAAISIAAGGMTFYILIVKKLSYFLEGLSRFELSFYIIFIISTGACIYICLLLRFEVFTKKQLSVLPFSTFILRLHTWLVKKG